MPAEPGQRPLGRREARKADTKRRLHAEAIALFRTQGYDGTTVADIAAAAGVAERTYFRYFATKREVILWDTFDAVVAEGFRRQPRDLTSIEALRAAMRDGFERLSPDELAAEYERNELMLAVPELRAAMLDQLATSAVGLAALLRERLGPDPDDDTLASMAGAIVGVTMAVQIGTVASRVPGVPAALDAALAGLDAGYRHL